MKNCRRSLWALRWRSLDSSKAPFLRVFYSVDMRLERCRSSPESSSSRKPPREIPPPGASEPTATFPASARLVIVDVVATDWDGNPIAGLSQGEFTILEDGKPQQIQTFEPHIPAKQLAAVPDLHLPPHEFTNFPKQVANSAVNVVLFDILNTPTDDQLYGRQQMIEFLKRLPRGQRVALFTLGYELKMIAGFTTSTDELIATAKNCDRASPRCSTRKREWRRKTT